MWIQKVSGGGIDGLAYSPDGQTLYTADSSNTFSAWDVAAQTGRRLFRWSGDDRSLVWGIAVLADGRHLLVNSYAPVVWDLTAGAELARLAAPTPHDALPLPPDHTRLLYRSEDSESLLIWEPERNAAKARFAGPFHSSIRDFAVSPTGRTVAVVAIYSTLVTVYEVGTMLVHARPHLLGYDGSITGVRYAPDGRALAVFCGKELFLWDLSPSRQRCGPIAIDNAHGDATFAFHPSAPAFVAVNRDKQLTLFSSETGAVLRSLDFALGKAVRCACFSPDGLTCAAGGSNKQFAVFDVDI
jgi:WD40 repeat protein